MRAHLIFNPQAGQQDGRRQVARAVEWLEQEGWTLELHETHTPEDVTVLARQAAASGAEAVLVVGGDGTVNGAVNGLAGTDVALGVLPMGTGNVWAAELGLIPTPTPLHRPDLLAAARLLSAGQVRRIDLGQAIPLEPEAGGDARYFLLWAGVGFDAAVARHVETELRQVKRRWGALSFLLAGVSLLVRYLGTRMDVHMDGHIWRERAVLLLVCNIQLYAGMVRVAPDARLDDGLLNVYLFQGRGFTDMVRHVVQVLLRRHRRDPLVRHRAVREATVCTARPLPVQVDGEPIGTTPMRFEIVPQALSVLVPPNVPPTLFIHSGDEEQVP